MDMDHKIIRQLYHAALKQDADTGKVTQKTKADIEELLAELKTEAGSQEPVIHTDEVFLAAAAAEENGFVKGFLYAFQLFTECAGR